MLTFYHKPYGLSMQRLCKPRAEYQACLNVFAEVQPILCKDNEFNSILHYHWAKCFQVQQIKDIDTVTERIILFLLRGIILDLSVDTF